MSFIRQKINATLKIILFNMFIYHSRFLHRVGVLPFSRKFGSERGTPIGRYYVEKFIKENSSRIRGRCLEFGEARYKSFFNNVDSYSVLDVIVRPDVDIVCDIHDIQSIPKQSFDAIVCTQVFEHLAYPDKASSSIFKLLTPGGILLLTAPFINPVHYVPTDFRRFTPECLEMLLRDAGFEIDSVDFGGNSLVGTGSLLGMVQEDFSVKELELKDPIYPYNVLVRAHRPTR